MSFSYTQPFTPVSWGEKFSRCCLGVIGRATGFLNCTEEFGGLKASQAFNNDLIYVISSISAVKAREINQMNE